MRGQDKRASSADRLHRAGCTACADCSYPVADGAQKSKGAVGVLKVLPHKEGLLFPDGSVWTKYNANGTPAAKFAGAGGAAVGGR